jgi:G:T-mismatch repair DNA endonuclease (very short patch repair protein)/predicted  nucleic acid-binding Zn-ribbon protein
MPRKLTKEDFISKAKEVHKDKYDYKNIEYINGKTKVKINCIEVRHGVFDQRPDIHLSGSGCPKCAGTQKSNTEDFISKAKEVHKDKYDYKNIEYINGRTKVIITCIKSGHGGFEQTPNSHLRGHGCPKCALGYINTEEFISKAKEKHLDKYIYNKVNYQNSVNNVIITCIKPGHGDFEQTPNSHLSGQGCPKCGGTQKSNTEDFINRAKEVHDNKYDYKKVEYINARTNVKITCLEDGHGEFEQTPVNHLRGQGCPKCAGNQLSNTEEFISKAKEVHKDKYDYKKVDYINNITNVIISCIKNEHGDFEQMPSGHLSGSGCPKCAGNQLSNTEEFINKAKEVHRDKYDYTKVEYQTSVNKVIITCIKPGHGDFKQKPSNHLSGNGCPKCAGNQLSNTEEFISKAKEVHKDKYDYKKVDYINARIHVIIMCIKAGHEFEQTPYSHLSGDGCPKCVPTWYSKSSISFLKTFPYPISHAENEGEKYIETKKRKYKVDGYFKASISEEIDSIFSHCHQDLFRFRNPNSLEVVIEFHGCFWHGCEKCYTERDAINSKNSKTYEDLYKATNRKKISIIKAGYNYIEIWECQYNCLVKDSFKTYLNT